MMTKVGVIGNLLTTPPVMDIPAHSKRLNLLMEIHNYTRVRSEKKLFDHIAYLKQRCNLAKDEDFSVWEMYSCASLLLKSLLERNGFEVLLCNYIDADNQTREFTKLQDFAPHIVILSTTFVLTANGLLKAGTLLREQLPESFLVAGGQHIFTALKYLDTQQKRDYLIQSKFDAFIEDSQGEAALLELLHNWPNRLDKINNLIWKARSGEVMINHRVIENNPIENTLLDFNGITPGAVVHIRTARSCAFKCAFCSYPTNAGELALMEVEDAITTLKKAKNAGVGAVFFVDDTFNFPKERFNLLLERMIEAEIKLPWYSFLRCQFIDESIVAKMKLSGCQGVFLGIESGSNQILKNMNKGGVTQAYRDGIQWLKQHDIITVGGFIIGFPGETQETIDKTVDFIETTALDFYFLQQFYYLHHTRIHQKAEQYGLSGQGLDWVHATMNSKQAK